MDINIKIVNSYKGNLPNRLEKNTQKIIKCVPDKYLRGINSIILVNQIVYKNGKSVGGIYIPPTKNEPAHIKIAIDVIYKGVPKFVFYLPFIKKFLLAGVLFHEIGHHNQLSNANLKKKDWEKHAEKFANKMLKKVFWPWLVLFIPFNYLNKFFKPSKH